jgi:uncharacterized membrane protein
MKTKLFIILALILLSSGRICHSQNYFVNTYGLDADPCLSIVCSDSCFFSVASNTVSSLLAFRTDPTGNLLWSRQISIPNATSLLLNDIAQAADGGYLILAYAQISGPVYSYQTVIKLDQAGNFLWTRSYTSISSNVAWSIIKNNDNGFMFVGGGCNGNNYVFKCNSHGAIVWQKQFTAATGDAFNIATHDYNHFIVSGYTGTDLVFFEIDIAGNLSWTSVISIPNQGIGTFSFKPALDNGYVGTGQVWTGAGGNQAFIIKIKPTGMLSWMKIYKVLNSESLGNDITECSDSSILMVGFSTTNYLKGLMVKTDKNGTLMFAKAEINQQSYSEYNSVNRYSSGKVLLSGQCQHGYLPTFIAVTDESFSSFCNTASLTVSDSIPGTSNYFITYTPVNLSFQTDSLSVSVTPYSLTKNVLCSSTVVPYATTGAASAITLNSAILNGSIMPAGDTLAAFFEYGTSSSYGSTVPGMPATVSGNNTISISVALASLTPNTVYHYRCFATHGINSYYGNDAAFITGCNGTTPVINGNDSLCPNSGFYTYLTQPDMLNYQWAVSNGGTITSGAGTPAVQVIWQQSGNRWIRVSFMDSAGCATISPTVFPVFVKYLPNPAGPITGLQTVCAGTESVSYHADPVPGASAYSWTLPPGVHITQGQYSNEILVNFTDTAQSGTFIVSGNNLCGNGPGSPEFPVTVNPKPPDPFITQSGDTLVSDAPAGNQWLYQQQPIPGETGTWYVPGVNGDFSVIVTLNGCPSEPSNVIHFILNGNENAFGNQNFIVFPNPSSGQFYLAGRDFPDAQATVYNLTGVKVYDDRVRMNRIDLSDFPPGIYLLTVSTIDGIRHFKIQIMN